MLRKPLEDEAMKGVEEDILDIYRPEFWKGILNEDESLKRTIYRILKKEHLLEQDECD